MALDCSPEFRTAIGIFLFFFVAFREEFTKISYVRTVKVAPIH